MKYNALVIKVLFLLFLFLNVSCTSDDACEDGNLTVNFPIKIKLVSLDGENLFNNMDFNPSLLKITDISNSVTERVFSQVIENGETLITFQALNMDSASFEYDAVNKFYFGFQDIETEEINCTIEVTNYLALGENGNLVCDCSINEVLIVTLDL